MNFAFLNISQHFTVPSVQSMDTQFGATSTVDPGDSPSGPVQVWGGPRKRGYPPPPVLGCYGPEPMGNAEWGIQFIDSCILKFRITRPEEAGQVGTGQHAVRLFSPKTSAR